MIEPVTPPVMPPGTPGHANLPKVTLAQAAEALEWNRAGESQRKLAAEVGVSRSVLGDWL